MPYHVIANKCAIFFCVHPGLTGNAAPYKWGSVYHECYMCNRARLSAGSGNPALPRF